MGVVVGPNFAVVNLTCGLGTCVRSRSAFGGVSITTQPALILKPISGVPMRKPPKYPEVELPEAEFQQLLDLVEALDPQQLLRLYCKVVEKVDVVGDDVPPGG